MKKLVSLLKVSVALGVLGFVLSFLYLAEWGASRADIDLLCREKGVAVPLQDPRLVVDFSNKTMTLFEGEVAIKRYDVGVGTNQSPGVIWRDAASTPLGEYKIIEKSWRQDMLRRGTRFLRIDFPGEDDLDLAWQREKLDDEQYRLCVQARDRGEAVPAGLPLNNEVGIQGNYFEFRGFHVTSDGSIAMRNVDINELYEVVEVGTPVIIQR